jgi:DNA-binding MarR family transcriptional regulator
MTVPTDRVANVVGAFALAVVDRMERAIFDHTDLGGEAVAALVAIGHSPGMTISQLSKVLARSHPGTVRIVDRLAVAGLVERKPGAPDRRSVTLDLTGDGVAERAEILQRRMSAIQDFLNAVAPEDFDTLQRIAATTVGALPDDATSALAICRYCDERRCPACPMESFGLPTQAD